MSYIYAAPLFRYEKSIEYIIILEKNVSNNFGKIICNIFKTNVCNN